ncbi:Uncharacterized conserved protein YafD, endonuclease/exonuclease/phosphatase (EEP) superfamily [Flavobacteriaceae bacterium MAR_2010_188]|nr:Uncharacterized conserved protein YafD, endonuclease/exonuclease/phosphatase (EEP) superfamily [Flavobacteriaceae bacterium MAR_2010_188]
MTVKTFLYGLGIVAIILTLIPLLPFDNWYIRMFDFPHVQLTVVTMIAILAFSLKFKIDSKKEYLFMAVMIGCFIYQFIRIAPYTPIKDVEVLDSTTENEDRTIKLFTANVLQKNREYHHLGKLLDSIDPDIVLITEADEPWRQFIVKNLDGNYPYSKEVPLPNTYGMLLYSKLELINPTVHYQVDDSIPSIMSKVKLRSGDIFQLYSIHPTPPMPQENPKSTDRDAEMMITARLARESDLPVIVLGDFNDVAWSKTTSLFKSTGELLDVRIGRGLYCSFDANNKILRWPLDHLFISEEFRLKEIDLCRDINSDHFPFYSKLTFEPERASEQKPKPPTEEQLEDAQDQLDRFYKDNKDFIKS